MRAPKYCSYRDPDTGLGCMTLVPGGTRNCAEHRSRWDIGRSKHQTINDAAWKRKRRDILDRDCHTCVYCGEPATEVDHIVARAHGGTDDDANLVASCHDCNEAKRKREALESRLA